MELDHFRPRRLFPQLSSEYSNIYYSCNPCNGFKWSRWPSPELESRGFGFVDPCQEDASSHYLLAEDGALIPLTNEARYTIETCLLNREHLRATRARLKATGEFGL